VFEIVAIIAALSFGFGTFLTKGVTTQISFLKTIGPLFLLNALFASPLALIQKNWIVFEPKILTLHLTGAIASGVAAYLIFSIIARSSASIASISSTLAPAVVLVLAPLGLGTSVAPIQVLLVLILIAATLYPIRSSIPGLRSAMTILLTLSAALATGFVSVNVAMLGQEGVNLSETFIVRQAIAGLVYILIFPPIGLNKGDLFKLIRRASFMSLGWVTSIYALQGGEIILIVSIMATVTLWVLFFESVAARKLPERSNLLAGFIAFLGVVSLGFLS
jgi:drug/metabolite transporter (DMT)-like permease